MEVHLVLGTQRLLELEEPRQRQRGANRGIAPVPSIEDDFELETCQLPAHWESDGTYVLRRSAEGDLCKVLGVHEVCWSGEFCGAGHIRRYALLKGTLWPPLSCSWV